MIDFIVERHQRDKLCNSYPQLTQIVLPAVLFWWRIWRHLGGIDERSYSFDARQTLIVILHKEFHGAVGIPRIQ